MTPTRLPIPCNILFLSCTRTRSPTRLSAYNQPDQFQLQSFIIQNHPLYSNNNRLQHSRVRRYLNCHYSNLVILLVVARRVFISPLRLTISCRAAPVISILPVIKPSLVSSLCHHTARCTLHHCGKWTNPGWDTAGKASIWATSLAILSPLQPSPLPWYVILAFPVSSFASN